MPTTTELDERLAALETKVDELENKVDEIDTAVEELEKESVSEAPERGYIPNVLPDPEPEPEPEPEFKNETPVAGV